MKFCKAKKEIFSSLSIMAEKQMSSFLALKKKVVSERDLGSNVQWCQTKIFLYWKCGGVGRERHIYSNYATEYFTKRAFIFSLSLKSLRFYSC